MKLMLVKTFLSVSFAALGITSALAHTIGGAYAAQISCKWGQYGNLYGNIGTYNVNGQIITQFFGNTICPV